MSLIDENEYFKKLSWKWPDLAKPLNKNK
jgi:hypothetical protein